MSHLLICRRRKPNMISRFRNILLQLPAHQLINMPALSPTMTQGNISEWRKKAGDKLQPGDILAEIETDKAQMEFEFQDDGYIAKLLFEGGSKDIKIGTPIAVLVENQEDVDKFDDFESPKPTASPVDSKAKVQTEKAPEPPKPIISEQTKAFSPEKSSSKASPLVKKLAKLENVDVSKISGTGPNGRIVLADYIKFKSSPSSSSSVKSNFKDIPISQMRLTIAERLSFSKTTIPHYYLTCKMNVDKLILLRQSLKEQQCNVSINDFVNKAVALTLRDHPDVNSSWMGDVIRKYASVDLSMAVATEKGLITPIIKNADKLGLKELNSAAKSLAEKARNNQLKPEEFIGGSFCVSNLGMYGIDSFNAIINPPQSGIVAVSAIKNEVKLVNENGKDKVLPTRVMSMTTSFDHRVVDGAVGALFMQTLKEYIENPLLLLK
eukprot:NODE_12_length_45166_cov_0.552511.p7 type:complete len:437 gc:universal NODE_12_length_45166_cov_0.552511:44962-43652(-)